MNETELLQNILDSNIRLEYALNSTYNLLSDVLIGDTLNTISDLIYNGFRGVVLAMLVMYILYGLIRFIIGVIREV